jgi:hypothetical protein
MIVGQNALLNQFVPTFIVKDPIDGQGLVYNSIYKAFVNSKVIGSGGADKLGELLNVSDTVDNPLSLQNGQALIYNTLSGLWENRFIDYSSIINAPVVKAPTNQVVFGNHNGTGLTSSSRLMFDPATNILYANIVNTTKLNTGNISANNALSINTNGVERLLINVNGAFVISGSPGISGQILTSNGPGLSPIWKSAGAGTVTSVSAAGLNGVLVTGSPITTAGTLTFSLGAITPTSVAATGTVTGSNITGTSTGTNTGDQIITLTGDVHGSGTGTFTALLTSVNTDIGTFGSATQTPQITVDSKGRITSVVNVDITGGGGGGSGTVTSVNATGGSTGMTFLNGPITTAGSLTLSGLLNVSAGGTGATSLTGYIRGNGGSSPFTASTTIPGIDISGNIPGSAGGVTGVVAIVNGGTGGTTPQTARNNLLPPQASNAGKVLSTDGTNVSWITSSGVGTVTSVAVTGNNGISVGGSPIINSGTIILGLGAITPTSIVSSGTIIGSNLSGTNTGNQTITLTGDVTGSGTGTFPATLSTTGVVANTYGSATQVPQFTVDAKGRVTAVTNVTISGGGGSPNAPEIVVFNYSPGSSGNFTVPDALFSKTAGVSQVNIIDGLNCVATYTFLGKANPPKSITLYGQNFSANTFSITGMPGPNAAQTFMYIDGGGTNTAPDIAHGIFTSENVVTLQTPMSFTGASAGLGNRAWLVIVFGF